MDKIKRLFSGYYNFLLICLTLLFIFRPFNTNIYYLAVWKLILALGIMAAIFNSQHKRTTKIVVGILAIPAILFGWVNIFYPKGFVFIINASSTILFMAICTSSILYDVVLRAKVTLETLRGVICAYCMIAFAFAYIYYLIEFLIPGSFHILDGTSAFTYGLYLSKMLYFSFTTLVTLGYGDITAIKDVGETASVIEATIGQFYIAILVARIVAVYSFSSHKQKEH